MLRPTRASQGSNQPAVLVYVQPTEDAYTQVCF